MEGTDMGSAWPLPFAGKELAHDPTTHRAASSASPRTEPAKVGDPNSAPPSARVEPGQGRGKVAIAGIPRNTWRMRIGRQRCRIVDFTVGEPDLRGRPHGRRTDLPPEHQRLARLPRQGRAHDPRLAQASGSRWDAFPLAREERSSFAREPRGSRVGARERHQSSGIVSQGTCLHDLLSCRNPEDRGRRCGDCLFTRPLRGPGGRRSDGLGKGHRPPAPGTGFGGYRRSSP